MPELRIDFFYDEVRCCGNLVQRSGVQEIRIGFSLSEGVSMQSCFDGQIKIIASDLFRGTCLDIAVDTHEG
jgi:hypothetical protein